MPALQPDGHPPELLAHIEQLCRQRWASAEIAARLPLGRSTVARLVARLGLARLKTLGPRPPVQRYYRRHPGELVRLDFKKRGPHTEVSAQGSAQEGITEVAVLSK